MAGGKRIEVFSLGLTVNFLVQMLLSNPVLENAVNTSAARIFASSPSGFRQTVLDCVLASKRVEGELQLYLARIGLE